MRYITIDQYHLGLNTNKGPGANCMICAVSYYTYSSIVSKLLPKEDVYKQGHRGTDY